MPVRLRYDAIADARLKTQKLRKVRARNWVPLSDVPVGSVVCYQGEWAVVERNLRDNTSRSRILEYWDWPREVVALDALVEVAPSVVLV